MSLRVLASWKLRDKALSPHLGKSQPPKTTRRAQSCTPGLGALPRASGSRVGGDPSRLTALHQGLCTSRFPPSWSCVHDRAGVLKFTSTSQRRNQKFRREKSLERRHAVRAGTSAKRTASPSPALCRLLRGKRWCARTPGGPSRSPSRAHGPCPPTLGWLAAGPQLCPSLETPIGSRAWHTQGHAPSQRAARGQGLAACFDVEQVKGSPGSSPLPGTRGSGGPEGEASCRAGSSSPWAA